MNELIFIMVVQLFGAKDTEQKLNIKSPYIFDGKAIKTKTVGYSQMLSLPPLRGMATPSPNPEQ